MATENRAGCFKLDPFSLKVGYHARTYQSTFANNKVKGAVSSFFSVT